MDPTNPGCPSTENTRPPRELPRGPHDRSYRRYFFFAVFIVPDPQEDLLLFEVFFDMHAIAVPPLRSDEWDYRRAVRFPTAAFTPGFLTTAPFAARAGCAAALNSPSMSSRNLS
jgi:hypothetical protein